MMNYENILVQIEGLIQTITINRPSKLNALNKATILELSDALKAADSNNNVRVVVLTGSGEKAFVAGADISEFAHFSVEQGKALSKKGHDDLFNMIDRMGTPVIAAVNGFALGGGLELAMSSHIRIFSENARVGLPETSLGVIPGYGGTQRLAQIAGKGRAMQMVLTAEMIDANTALSFGITNKVVPQAELLDAAYKMAGKIIKNSPMAVSTAIQCVNANYQSGVDGLDYEVGAFGDCFGTEDFKEGTTAFLEKRKANY
jgi:enoyl-CoA hydratase